MSSPLTLNDSFGRTMRDLRVSITDRCNFRCLYCLPETEEAANFYRGKFDALKNPQPTLTPIVREWKRKSALLTYEKIERVVRVAVGLGIEKVRITGGEPLLRRDVAGLVARLAPIPGIRDLAMTTNDSQFAPLACTASASASIRSIPTTSSASPGAMACGPCSRALSKPRLSASAR